MSGRADMFSSLVLAMCCRLPERCWSQIGYRRKQFGVPLLSFSCRLVVTDDMPDDLGSVG